MAKKGYKKKRAFKTACYRRAKEGKINLADGSFVDLSRVPEDGMKRGYRAGYRV